MQKKKSGSTGELNEHEETIVCTCAIATSENE